MAQITVRGICTGGGFGTAMSCGAFSTAPQSGDVIIGTSVSAGNTTGFTTAVTGCGYTWTNVNTFATTHSQSINKASVGSSGACTPTGTITTNHSWTMVYYDLTGVTTTTDGSNFKNSGFGTGAITGPSITTAVNGDFVFTIGTSTGAQTYSAFNGSWTVDYNATPSGGEPTYAAHIVQSTAGAISLGYSQSAGNNDPLSAAALEASGGAVTCSIAIALMGVGCK